MAGAGPPDDLAALRKLISTFFQNGVHVVEYRFRRKDGSYRWVNDEQHLIRGADGKPLEIVVLSDVTARKAAEEAAQQPMPAWPSCSPARPR